MTTTKKTTKKPVAKKFKEPAETSMPAAPKAAYKRGPADAAAVLLAQRQQHGKEMHKALMMGVLQLNQNIIDLLVVAFENGHHSTSAVRSVGIPKNKFRNWLIKGAKDAENYELIVQNGGKLKPKDLSMEYQLLARLNKANFTFEDELLQKVRNAESWQAHMAILSKKYPDRWGDKKQVDVNQTSTTTHVFVTPREATIEEWQAEQKKIAEGVNFIDSQEVHETGGDTDEGEEEL